jgi:hypothetical protein
MVMIVKLEQRILRRQRRAPLNAAWREIALKPIVE